VAFYFFDTSALVKRYHLEPGSERVNAILDDQNNVPIISELAIVELVSALRRKRNRGEITPQAMDDALAHFAHAVLSDLIVAGFRSGFIQQARDLVLPHNPYPSSSLAHLPGCKVPFSSCSRAEVRPGPRATESSRSSVLRATATPSC